jgi:hypothetical protein
MDVRLLFKVTNLWQITRFYFQVLTISSKSDYGLSLDGLPSFISMIEEEDKASILEIITYLHSSYNEKFLQKLAGGRDV